MREHGDFIRFRLGRRPVYLINHPDAIRHVLRTGADHYDKDTRTTAFLRDITGESLLTANGDEWERRRRLFQPAFHHQAVEGFAAIMREEAAALVQRLSGRHEFDAAREMMGVTFRIVARALFGTSISDETVASIEEPIGIVLEESFARHGSLFARKSRRFTHAMRQLDAAVGQVLEKARAHGNPSALLALMRDGHVSTDDLRNESVTFLLAGHETTANALTWLLAYLGRHPDEQDRAARDPAALDRTLHESLRLAPPIWIIERHAITANEIAGYSIPAGASVVVCPYTLHRHLDFWDDPETFRPDRFLQPPPPAYLPFGLGPRVCIGREFALLEARIIAGALLDRFEFTPVDPSPPVAQPAITLRIRGGLPLRLRSRS